MGKVKCIVKFIVVVGLTLAVWGLCLGYAQSLQTYLNTVDIKYEENKLTLEQLKVLQKEAHYKSVGWSQSEGVGISNPSLNQSMNGTVVSMYGDSNLLVGMNGSGGALVTESIAYELWGSVEVEGETIEVDGKEYIVKGVMDDQQAYIFIPVDEAVEEITFDGLRVDLEGVENVPDEINVLEMKYGLPQGINDNISLKINLLSQLLFVPIWLLVGYSLLKLYKWMYHHYHYWVLTVGVGIAALILTWVIIQTMGISISIPYYILPNQWSDFEFWVRTMEQIVDNTVSLQSLPSYVVDQKVDQLTKMYVIYLGLGIVGSISIINLIKVSKTGQLFWQIFGSILLSFVTIIGIHVMGLPIESHIAVWIGIPMYLWIMYSIRKLNQFVEKW